MTKVVSYALAVISFLISMYWVYEHQWGQANFFLLCAIGFKGHVDKMKVKEDLISLASKEHTWKVQVKDDLNAFNEERPTVKLEINK